MTDERQTELVRAALPAAQSDGPARDVWPQIASRIDEPPHWSYLDLALAAAAAAVLAMFPEYLWLLAYHL
jgi:hypothetical protein